MAKNDTRRSSSISSAGERHQSPVRRLYGGMVRAQCVYETETHTPPGVIVSAVAAAPLSSAFEDENELNEKGDGSSRQLTSLWSLSFAYPKP